MVHNVGVKHTANETLVQHFNHVDGVGIVTTYCALLDGLRSVTAGNFRETLECRYHCGTLLPTGSDNERKNPL